MKLQKSFQLVGLALVITCAAASAFAQTTRQEKMLNGLKVYLSPDVNADKTSVSIRIHYGSAFDQQGKEGTMKLLSQGIFPTDAAKEFFTDDLGGSLDVVCNYDFIEIDATSKPSELYRMLDYLAQAVTTPDVDAATTAGLKKALAAEAAAYEDGASTAADMAVRKRLYGAFPYGRPVIGTRDSIAKIDFADLKFAQDRLFGADNASLALSGNFNSDLAFKAVRRYFGSWLKSDVKFPSTFRQPDAPKSEVETGTFTDTSSRGEMRWAFRGVGRSDRNFAASKVLAAVYEQRLKIAVPAPFSQQVSVKSESHILPGEVIFSISAVSDEPSFDFAKANSIVAAILAAKVTDAEFGTAKAAVFAELNARKTSELWLDKDTYRFDSVKADADLASQTSIADVQKLADRYRAQPIAAVALLPASSK